MPMKRVIWPEKQNERVDAVFPKRPKSTKENPKAVRTRRAAIASLKTYIFIGLFFGMAPQTNHGSNGQVTWNTRYGDP